MPMIVDWVELIHELIAFGMTLSIRFDTQRALIPQCSPPGQRGKGTTLCWRGNWQQPLVGNGSSCSPLICGWAVTLEDAFLGKLLEHNSENIYEISSGSTTGIMRMAWQIKTPNKKCILPTVREKQSPSLVNWWVFCSCWLTSWGDFCSLYCATKWQLPGRSGAHAPTTRWGDVGTESGILRADQSNSVSPPEKSQSTLLYLRNP